MGQIGLIKIYVYIMNVLELFSGTGSVGKCCDKLGIDVVSVDNEFKSTHQEDILNFNYKQYPKDYFDIVWASPPCTEYSILQNCWIGRVRKGVMYTKEIKEKNMQEADKLVLKSLEIIKYFNPAFWYIENPATSELKSRPFMKDLPFYNVDYCMYSDWGYRKRTRIWTNKKDWNNKLCDGSGKCGNMINKQHVQILGNGYEMIDGKKVLCNTKEKRDALRIQKIHVKNLGKTKQSQYCRKHLMHQKNACNGGVDKRINRLIKGTTQQERYRIPEDLIFSLFLD